MARTPTCLWSSSSAALPGRRAGSSPWDTASGDSAGAARTASGAASQNIRVRSSLAEASVRPSGLNATFPMCPACPLRTSTV